MDFSLNISKEDLIINNVRHSLTDDDFAYLPKDHLRFSNDNLGQSSFSGWSPSPILTGISGAYNQNMIPLIPNQNFNPLYQNLVNTQNLPVYNSFVTGIPSKNPFMNIGSYSTTDTFEKPMYTITNNNQNSIIFYDYQGDTMWSDTMHNKKVITSGYESSLDKFMVESHSFDFQVPDGVKVTTKEIINHRQDHVMIKADQKKSIKVVKRSNPFKKSKDRWSIDEDRKLEDQVKSYGEEHWKLIAEHFEGRVGKQCRERWRNHLRCDFKRGPWSEEEDQILIEAHRTAGNKWSEISLELPGRSENAIKNHWNVTKRRMLSKNPLHDSILENYIRSVTINNDPPKDISDGNLNLSLDVTIQTGEPSINASTSSVPEPTMFSWDDYFTKVCESVDFKMFMDGWE